MELTDLRVYDIKPSEVVAAERDGEGISHLWLAVRRPQEVRYVSLSRSHAEVSVHLERDDQKWSCYDGVMGVSMDANELVVNLSRSAAESLGGVESIHVDCRGLNEETWERVSRAVRAIFEGTSVPLAIV